jgi:hypothetical protein
VSNPELTTCLYQQGNDRAERRRAPRFPFVAKADITDPASATKLYARVSELSLYGCYVDIINPLPADTQIVIKIYRETEFFEARATVIYAHPNLGMGLAFRDVAPHFLPTLRNWLIEAIREFASAKITFDGAML